VEKPDRGSANVGLTRNAVTINKNYSAPDIRHRGKMQTEAALHNTGVRGDGGLERSRPSPAAARESRLLRLARESLSTFSPCPRKECLLYSGFRHDREADN
jgi:hypothetical protein